MNSPLVSVVIPAYNQAQFVGQAIQSVLDQTFSDFEVIVVNDASPDNIAEVVKQFDDPRVRYMAHEENRGLPAARNTGMRTASGELIALLDSDDFFHPEKLRLHADYLARHPEIGASYNARYEMNYSAETIRELVRPPLSVELSDIVLGYPFVPSDMVVRRTWAFKVNLFDERHVNGGEDLDLPARLILAGCKFASVDSALNYRRHHAGRKRKNLAARLDEVLRILDTIFADPRCPAESVALRDIAMSNNYLAYGQYALSYGETILGQGFVREAVRLNPTLLNGDPSNLVKFLTTTSIYDDSANHEILLTMIFEQLPAELVWLAQHYDWAVGRGYLVRGVRALMWNRSAAGRVYFSKAYEKRAAIDHLFLQHLAYQLYSYEREFGAEAAKSVYQQLTPYLRRLGGTRSVRQLASLYSLNRAYHCYQSGQGSKVPGAVLQAFANDPKHLSNRGLLAMLFRTTLGLGKRVQVED